jgi:hypothetical protein
MTLTSSQKKRLPQHLYGLPAQRAYPIPDAVHARAALARAAQFATPEEQAEIKRNVRRLYPRIQISK